MGCVSCSIPELIREVGSGLALKCFKTKVVVMKNGERTGNTWRIYTTVGVENAAMLQRI